MRQIKFIHMGDTHLGFKQYHLNERFIDYNRAFNSVLKLGIKHDVDFILIAGDLFNSNNVNPETLTAIFQMITSFQQNAQTKLKKEIPIICIEGNHDKALYSSSRSWMTFLEELGLITILKPTIINDEVKFHSKSDKQQNIGYIRVKDAIIYGVPYYGASTKDLLPYIYNGITQREDAYNILMMHFGITGQVKDKMGFHLDKNILDLHDKVDYLALGHFHKMYQLPDKRPWIFNPGSIEINDVKEVWGENNQPYDRGIFLVEINGKKYYERKIEPILCANGKTHDEDKISNRFFFQTTININQADLTSFQKTLDYILRKLAQMGLRKRQDEEQVNLLDRDIPFLILSLSGTINYSKLELDIPTLREKIKEEYLILGLRIYSSRISSILDDTEFNADESRSIEKIEKDVFSTFIEANEQYAPHKNKLLTLISDLKTSLLSNDFDSEKVSRNIISWWETNIEEAEESSLLNEEGIVQEQEEFQFEGEGEINSSRTTESDESSSEENEDQSADEDLDMDLDELLEEDFDF